MNRTISIVRVNPGASTLGALHPESVIRKMRVNVYDEAVKRARRRAGSAMRMLFGSMSVSGQASKVLMISRMLFGIFLIMNGFVVGSQLGHAYSPTAVFSVVAGGLLFPGIGMRVLMSVSALWFAVVGLHSISSGAISELELGIAAVSMIFAIFGPGRYSADAPLCKNLFRMMKRREMRRIVERRMSYKAMHSF